MRTLTLALAALALLVAPVFAVEVIELKNGRVIEASSVSVREDKVYIELYLPEGKQFVRYTMPVDKVVPEYVFYAWLGGLTENQTASHLELAAWARKNGLFPQARRAYAIAAESSQKVREDLPNLDKQMHEEEATWLFLEAERLFRDNDVKVARTRLERLLKEFGDTKEVARAKGLLMILAEREQFLSEQKKQEAIAQRARKQRRFVEKQLGRVGKADRMVLKARLGRPGDAKRRLKWAAYAYRSAALSFLDLLPDVEVDDLRLGLEATIDDLERRMVRTFLKLGDIRYLTGDAAGALEAVHEVLTLDPDNKEAAGLRERVLDAPARAVEVDRRSGYYPGLLYSTRLIGRRRHAFPYPHRVYRVRSSLGIAVGHPFCFYR